ncbi:MAG: 3-methyl-2-oxobutanoate hydroxymethyltransferase [bacterium]
MIRPSDFQTMKERGERFVRVNCYDYLTAKIIDSVGIEMILVGDSVGRNVLGYRSDHPTERTSIADMVHHTKAVLRGVTHACVIADLPVANGPVPPDRTVSHARRLVECGVQAVKIEGGSEMIPIIEALLAHDIPVHGTLREDPCQPDPLARAQRAFNDALSLETSGCFMITLAGLPSQVAKVITESLRIPTIGHLSGPCCDGQVQVINDLVGFVEGQPRKGVKTYANVYVEIRRAVTAFRDDVKAGVFPAAEHCSFMSETDLHAFKGYLASNSDRRGTSHNVAA